MSDKIHVAILSGGSGTRLWPLSREALPKQFFDLANLGRPLLADTVERLAPFAEPCIITTKALDKATLGLLKRFGLKSSIAGEPAARNTAAAVALATWQGLRKDPRAVVGVFPADHAIRDREAFARAVRTAIAEASQGYIVTLGIAPTYAADAYGYMELESATSNVDGSKVLGVKRFIEKPRADRAAELIATGRVVWNAGMFVFRADTMAAALAKHMPDLWSALEGLKPDASNLADIYPRLPSQSIDYGVMEKLADLRCVPAEMGWSDLGCWEEVAKFQEEGGAEPPLQVGGFGNQFINETPRPKAAAFVGVQDLVAVDVGDSLLVVKKGQGQSVREIVEALKRSGSSLAKTHDFEERPWGRFEILLDTDYFKSKRILVHPGERLSYQSHAKRAEHWIVVKGQAEVTLNDQVHRLKPGEHIYIPLGAKHRMANPGQTPMEFIEVQTGTYFGEDDIVRYEDNYGRV